MIEYFLMEWKCFSFAGRGTTPSAVQAYHGGRFCFFFLFTISNCEKLQRDCNTALNMQSPSHCASQQPEPTPQQNVHTVLSLQHTHAHTRTHTHTLQHTGECKNFSWRAESDSLISTACDSCWTEHTCCTTKCTESRANNKRRAERVDTASQKRWHEKDLQRWPDDAVGL